MRSSKWCDGGIRSTIRAPTCASQSSTGARSLGRRRRRIPTEPLEHHPAIDGDAIAVRTALAGLRQEEREALVLRYYLGLSDSQIAESVDRPIGTVKSQIHRGLARMKEALS
jgi:RNA polymerase sigma factor (sigma-70 family)